MLPTPDELSMCLLLHSPDRMFRPLTRPLCRNRLEGSRTPHARPGAVPRNDQLLRGDSDCLVYYHWSRERRPTGTIAVGGLLLLFAAVLRALVSGMPTQRGNAACSCAVHDGGVRRG